MLLTQGIHTLDLLLSLVGPAAEVTANVTTTPVHRMETEDYAAAAVRYRNGAFGTIEATTAAFPGYPERIEIMGDKGCATIEGTALKVALMDGQTIALEPDASAGGTGADPMAFPHDYHLALITDFLDALDAGRDPRVTGEEALKVHFLIDAILEAGAHGQERPPFAKAEMSGDGGSLAVADPFGVGEDLEAVVARDGDKRDPRLLRRADGERRRGGDRDQDRRAKHGRLLHHLHRHAARQEEQRSRWRRSPVRAAAPTSLSSALWRPTSSRASRSPSPGRQSPAACTARVSRKSGCAGASDFSAARDRSPDRAGDRLSTFAAVRIASARLSMPQRPQPVGPAK